MATIVDYTIMRKGAKPTGGRSITVCPVCGRKGLPSIYKGKRAPFGDMTHKGHIDSDFGMFFIVDDHCFLSEKQVEEIE